ncbi:hypothetical protein RintRC_3734 [Richelia intracellularis]|nr:hypothetical protein RintRC_3734 [Richelia intracellularis]
MAWWTGLFPPGKGGDDGVAYGGKGKGIFIHTLTEGSGMPLSNRTTPANGSETDQVIPLLDSVKVKSNKRSRPRKPLKVLAADKGYDSKDKRAVLRRRSIALQWPKRVWKTKKNKGRPIKILSHLTTRTLFPMVKKNIVVLFVVR